MHTAQPGGRAGGQQAPEACTALAEDDGLGLTALWAVTIYCVVFPEGQQGKHNAQSPDEQASRHSKEPTPASPVQASLPFLLETRGWEAQCRS